jgi:membrane-associated protein
MIKAVIDLALHLDVHLAQLTHTYGVFTYLILFIIIFCETGLVVTPFLPGDSLLFAGGAIAALGGLNIFVVLIILMAAAILGDTANYWIGHFFGAKLIAHPKSPIKKAPIDNSPEFFEKYGGKTIILARFVPVVRTFAPFVAGIGKMHYRTFISFNIIGGLAWSALFILAGYFFGNISFIKHNFSLVILAIIVLSMVPMVIEFLNSRKAKTTKQND